MTPGAPPVPEGRARTVGRALVGLYPQAFRERWGHELAGEAERAGWRGWPRLVLAIAGMWLHPAVWPAASFAERRRRVAALAVVVTAVGWLTAHAVLELTGAVPRALAHSWLLTVCELTTFLGFLLAVPIPRLRRTSIVHLVRTAAKRLALPLVLGAVIVFTVNDGIAVGAVIRSVVVAGWWLTLALGAWQAVRTIADVDLADVAVPSSRRLGLGLWLAAGGLTASGLTILMPSLVGNGDRIAGVVGGAVLLILAAAVNGTVRDLAEVRTA